MTQKTENNSTSITLDESICPYLDEIAKRLWSSHASIMVGAGFSLNANKDFPAWSALGDLFFEKTHCGSPDSEEEENKGKGKNRYLNALKLADEVQAAFGRPVLNQLLRSAIPDKDSKPSTLHYELLELPWTDVFTTNYDTLLERAREKVVSQKFDVVVNKEDLVYSEKPRIIKLHGSFPSERPFIITEEDYRTYPKKFAPFVNTVQQSMLENTLCLIGFSGDDPNFLQWIGWIRDNLGKENAPKIYLVGVFDFSEAEQKLLEKRNICVVDLGKCKGIDTADNEAHYNALEFFFKELNGRKKEDSRLNWPGKQTEKTTENNTDKLLQLKAILNEWKRARIDYPGWVVVPNNIRITLWNSTEKWIRFIATDDDLTDPLDLTFAYELNWRLEQCLAPITYINIDSFEAVINKYWPFKEVSDGKPKISYSDAKYQHLNWNEIRKMWISLTLSLIRYYREKGKFTQWDEYNDKLGKVYQHLTNENKAFLHYERALYALFQLDLKKVKFELRAWPENFSIPYWETKRAGLLSELGQIDEAERILEYSLKEIRSKLSLKPVTTDYSLVSEEAFTMLLLKYVKFAIDLKNGNWDIDKEISRQFSKRWDVLKQYKCDPWAEIKHFDDFLQREPIIQAPITEKYEFGIGKKTTTHHFSLLNNEAVTAYNFLRFFEDSGFPFRFPRIDFAQKSAIGTLQRISNDSSYWTMATLIRIGKADAAKKLFNRQFIYQNTIETIDAFIDQYLSVLKNAEPEIAERNEFAVLLAGVIPEILSRLCCKCSNDRKKELLDFILKSYTSKYAEHYKGIKNLFKMLLESYTEEECYQLIPIFIEIPYPENIALDTEYINPFQIMIGNGKVQYTPINKIVLSDDKINILFSHASSDNDSKRTWGLFSLIFLSKYDFLSELQNKKLGETLWSKTDDDDFPSHTGYYKFSLIELPHPKNISPDKLLQQYIIKSHFQVNSIPIIHEVMGSYHDIDWSKKELDIIFKKSIQWLSDNINLFKKEDSNLFPVPGWGKSQFTGIMNIIIEVVLSEQNIKLLSLNQQQDIQKLIDKLDKNALNTTELKVAVFSFLQMEENVLMAKLEGKLSSNDDEKLGDGLNAFLRMVASEMFKENDTVEPLLVLLGNRIRWQHQSGLKSIFNTVEVILEKHQRYFDSEFESNCLIALKSLTSETKLEEKLTEKDFFNRLELRQRTARFSFKLFLFYEKNDFTIPEEVLLWQEICSTPDEFAEIRVQWNSSNND